VCWRIGVLKLFFSNNILPIPLPTCDLQNAPESKISRRRSPINSIMSSKPIRASARSKANKRRPDYTMAEWSGSSDSEEDEGAKSTKASLPSIPEGESIPESSIGIPGDFDFKGADHEDESVEEESTANPKQKTKKKTPAKKSPAMVVGMPDSTERASTTHQITTTARKGTYTISGGNKIKKREGSTTRLTKNCRVHVQQSIVLKIVPAELHAVVRSFGSNKTRRFYGTCLPKTKNDGKSYRIKLDDLPPGNNVHLFSRRSFVGKEGYSCYDKKERQTETQACSSDTIGKEEEDW
jgi:hypothetical protein